MRLLNRIIYICLCTAIIIMLAGIVSAVDCAQYDDDQVSCKNQADCMWFEDPWGSWCDPKGCWNMWSQTACEQANNASNTEYFINKSCSWRSSGSGYCEMLECWAFQGTNQSYCEQDNPYGLGCVWEDMCMQTRPGVDCAQYDNDQTA